MTTTAHAATQNAHPNLEVLAGGIAIITGGASGIGLGLAEAAIQRGMYPVLADIESAAITGAQASLQPAAEVAGVEVFGCSVDVSSAEAVTELGVAISQRFPGKPISLLCCNAGVGGGGSVLTAKEIDWDFVLGVNVMGVANCIRTFVPAMLDQGAPGTIVTTASQDGLCCAQGVYGVSKHASVALTEALYSEVVGKLSVHVLCPNVVATNIVQSERNRPAKYGGPPEVSSAREAGQKQITERFKAFGMPPSRCAELVFDAIQSGEFYILAEVEEDPGYVRLEAQTRMNAILDGGLPSRPRSELLSKVFDLRRALPSNNR